ncbi:MAG: hypothetical protein ACT4PP_15075 [Sporichthyaceae bacterium]
MNATSILGAFLAVAGLILSGGCSDSKSVEGPLMSTRPTAVFGLDLSPRQSDFTMAQLYLQDPGQAVEILTVESVRSPNVMPLGAMTVWPRDFRSNDLLIGPGYPEKGISKLRPLGEIVPAEQMSFQPKGFADPVGLAIVAGFRLVGGDVGVVNGIRVKYLANGRVKYQTFKQAAFVCVRPRACAPPKGTPSSTWENGILAQFGLLPEGESE